MKRTLFFLLSCSPAFACRPLPCAAAVSTATSAGAGGPGLCIFGGQSGKSFGSEAAFKSVVWRSDVIYVGGTTDRTEGLMAQTEVLKTMRVARGSKIAVGFEMLDATLQPALDDYVSGKTTEAEFFAKAGRKREGSFDFGPYRPIFDFIIQNRLKALALNVPETALSKIALAGLIGLDAEWKKFLPEPVNVSGHKKYLQFLKAAFEGGGGADPSETSAWDNYLASVSASNEGMGANIAGFLNANPGWSVLVIAGKNRLMYNAGIPASVRARTGKIRQASFLMEDAACPAALPKEARDTANYVWYVNREAPAGQR